MTNKQTAIQYSVAILDTQKLVKRSPIIQRKPHKNRGKKGQSDHKI